MNVDIIYSKFYQLVQKNNNFYLVHVCVCVCVSLSLFLKRDLARCWIIAQGKNCGGNVRICCHIGGRGID
jgi:hypothetical protein